MTLDPTTTHAETPTRDLDAARELLVRWHREQTAPPQVLALLDWALHEVAAYHHAVVELGGMALDTAHAATELAVLIQGIGLERLRVEETAR
jgi:hypothetical protein